MTLRADEHPPAPGCRGVHCWEHDTDEDAEGAYQRCLECGHVYRTTAGLEAAEARIAAQDGREPVTPVGDIFACPLCWHDFAFPPLSGEHGEGAGH